MYRSLAISVVAILTIFLVPLLAVTLAVDSIDKSMRAPAYGIKRCRCIGEGNSPSAAKIQQALRGQLKSPGLDFTEAPLKELVTYIEDTYDIPVQLDTVALAEEGIDPQEPVTAKLHGISLRSALRLMLEQLGLTYIIQDEVLIITSPVEAEAHLVICVYDVRDLLRATRQTVDFDPLIDTIVSCISSETWAENGGGESEIRPLPPGLLVISQTAPVHEEIEDFLNTVREMNGGPIATRAGPGASLDELVTKWNLRQ
jgi:hypothetical protein